MVILHGKPGKLCDTLTKIYILEF